MYAKLVLVLLCVAPVRALAFGVDGHITILSAAFATYHLLTGGFSPSPGTAFVDGNKATDWRSPAGLVIDSTGCGCSWASGGLGLCSPAAIEELRNRYGVCPHSHDLGNVQMLHATRNWSGTTGLSWVDSAGNTCAAMREAITYATLRAVELRRAGSHEKAYIWIGHATHIIEDSFSPGHTRRAPSSMTLLDHCTAQQDYPPWENPRQGLVSYGDPWAPVCAHHLAGNKDQLVAEGADGRIIFTEEAQAAVFADIGYLLLVRSLFAFSDMYAYLPMENVRRAGLAALGNYFDVPAYAAFPVPTMADPSRATVTPGGNRIAGYHACGGMNTSVPVSLTPGWSSEPAGDWTAFASFRSDNKPGYIAYKKGNGVFALDLVAKLPDGAVAPQEWTRGNIGAGWTSLIVYEADNRPYLLSYRSDNGSMRLDAVGFDANGLTPVLPRASYNWPAGLTAFVPVVINDQPYTIAYQKATGFMYVALLHAGRIAPPVQYLGVGPGYTTVEGFTDGGAAQIIQYNATTGVAMVSSVLTAEIARLQPSAPAVLQLRQLDWGVGWDSVLPFEVDSRSYFLKHNEDGRVQMDLYRPATRTTVIARQSRISRFSNPPVRMSVFRVGNEAPELHMLEYYLSRICVLEGNGQDCTGRWKLQFGWLQ